MKRKRQKSNDDPALNYFKQSPVHHVDRKFYRNFVFIKIIIMVKEHIVCVVMKRVNLLISQICLIFFVNDNEWWTIRVNIFCVLITIFDGDGNFFSLSFVLE